MPDIAMCANNKCKLRFKCYRFQAKASTYQSYCEFKPEDNCYWGVNQ